jgi:hypothetical protein
MEFEAGGGTEYRATAERLTDDDAMALMKDMTEALQLLTGGALRTFASQHREAPLAGQRVSVMRPGKIVVARYRGVREQLDAVGWGGRSTKGTTIRAGAVILDSEFDRTSDTRRLLRMHELGHALGYDHVDARQPSIMNPRIGSEPTRFDIAEGRSAFHDFPGAPRARCVSADDAAER